MANSLCLAILALSIPFLPIGQAGVRNYRRPRRDNGMNTGTEDSNGLSNEIRCARVQPRTPSTGRGRRRKFTLYRNNDDCVTQTRSTSVVAQQITDNDYDDDYDDGYDDDVVNDTSLPNGMRFSKVQFPENSLASAYESQLPLTSADYPIASGGAADMLRQSECWSVITQEDLHPRTANSPQNVDEILSALNLTSGPTHPSSSGRGGAQFWDEFDFVVQAQIQRRNCGGSLRASEVWDVPQTWSDFTLNDAAEAVHDEYPAAHQSRHLELMFQPGHTGSGFGGFGPNVTVDENIISERSRVQFVRGPVMLADLNTWAFAVVGDYNFAAKWMFGRARPEEVAWSIMTGEMGTEQGVPEHVVENVMKIDGFQKPADFTAYPEGCPTHPSWPAMHSAASNLSLWLAVVFDLTPEQFEEAKKVDYAVSFARTVAGVHYTSDNIDGLNLGQEVIARELPDYLSYAYGSDPVAVREKIQRVRFDWKDYDHTRTGVLLSCPQGQQVLTPIRRPSRTTTSDGESSNNGSHNGVWVRSCAAKRILENASHCS